MSKKESEKALQNQKELQNTKERIEEVQDDYQDSKEYLIRELQSKYRELKHEIEEWENKEPVTIDESKDLEIPPDEKLEQGKSEKEE